MYKKTLYSCTLDYLMIDEYVEKQGLCGKSLLKQNAKNGIY